jgi:hypothetical protein
MSVCKIKYSYIICFILLCACKQNPKTPPPKVSETETSVQVDSVEEKTSEAQDTIAEQSKPIDITRFNAAIDQTKTKPLPQIETTNFDSFNEPEDYDEVDVQLFQLESIYPNFHKDTHNFKAISKYKLAISEAFHSVVITIQKGDNEMETILINYDKDGQIISHIVVAYDEIAEGMSQIVSRINNYEIIKHNIFWAEKKQIEEENYSIIADGTVEHNGSEDIHETVENYVLINNVLTDLKLKWVQIKTDLIVVAENPNNYREAIIVIPRIMEEGEQYFALSSYIVVADYNSGNISHTYFESYQTNGWVSDALRLDEIKIDPDSYKLNDSTLAFGVRVNYFGASKVNPYYRQDLSLFIKEGKKLKNMLPNFAVEDSGGEVNDACESEIINNSKEFIISEENTNGFFDINVIERITETTTFINDNGDCNEKNVDYTKSRLLKFNGKTYTLDTLINEPLRFYLKDNVPDHAHIFTEPNGKVLYGLAQESDYILTVDAFGDDWFRVIKLDELDAEAIDLPRGYGWTHRLALAASTRTKVTLLDQPKTGKSIGTIAKETQVNILALHKNWVKIEYNGLTGWTEAKWLCGNPVTTCP